MSAWRKEASNRLPEFQRVIASRDVDNPMALWIELNLEYFQLCEQESPALDILRRFWGYAKWCMEQGSEDVSTAAAVAFCEHLLGSVGSKHVLPQIMSRQDYEGIKGLLLYHNSMEAYEETLKSFVTAGKNAIGRKIKNVKRPERV